MAKVYKHFAPPALFVRSWTGGEFNRAFQKEVQTLKEKVHGLERASPWLSSHRPRKTGDSRPSVE